MSGDGPGAAEPARRSPRFPCSRTFRSASTSAGRLLVVGCDVPGDGPPPSVAPHIVDRLDRAEVVFAVGEAEPTVLFYAEAWRVERLDGVAARDARRVAAWFADHPGATAVLVDSGDPHHVTTVVSSLLPALRVECLDGPGLAPPQQYPLDWSTE
ncbi:MAG: hypothetical protein J0I34_02895 [Pseudonocardia sp.]|uniref:hypothetical protein n=1 Tax=unclassified Pseudonocardia TaxID=2619320 RepID=UPI000868468E|nr:MULTISPECIES: hypothetical protein [unclassified Pseudonocardia]MBN9107707.1 hypothetical protein [Pseudonocardia sp.]ODV01231.1 MAG: hypothetical protein ABT15_27835 [Pseudonocardia sp. SCN 73-27]